MSDKDFEKKLLKLDLNTRADLAGKLLLSLEDLTEVEIERLWTEEALKRDEELSHGKAKFIPAEEVFKNVRSQLK